MAAVAFEHRMYRLFYLGHRIGRAGRKSGFADQRKVVEVVAHIGDLTVIQSAFGQPFVHHFDLGARAKIQPLDAQGIGPPLEDVFIWAGAYDPELDIFAADQTVDHHPVMRMKALDFVPLLGIVECTIGEGAVHIEQNELNIAASQKPVPGFEVFAQQMVERYMKMIGQRDQGICARLCISLLIAQQNIFPDPQHKREVGGSNLVFFAKEAKVGSKK